MEEAKKPSKKKKVTKYLLYVLFVLVATGLALFFSLKDCFYETIDALKTCDWRWLILILGNVMAYICLNASILWIFCRIYTRHYHYSSAIATVFIGIFYNGITPGASGGQPMQAYTMRKQGVEVSNAASILVMWFIIYQVALVTFGLVGFIFKFSLLEKMGSLTFAFSGFTVSLPVVPLIILGFFLNLFVVLLLFLMSYSHKLHNFIMNHGINLGSKLHLIKNPAKTRETLRIKVENFRIELKRLQSNIPLTILLFFMFVIYLILKFDIPWLAGVALNGYGNIYKITGSGWIYNGHTIGDYSISSFFDACFLSSFHQMVTGLIPIPGSAGVSELFFMMVFKGFYSKSEYITAAQIIWRTASFHLTLLVGGFVSAFYRSSPKEQFESTNSQTFVTMQLETYEARKASSETMFETSKLSTEEIKRRLKTSTHIFIKKNKPADEYTLNSIEEQNKSKPLSKKEERERARKEKELAKLSKSNKTRRNHDDWGDIDI